MAMNAVTLNCQLPPPLPRDWWQTVAVKESAAAGLVVENSYEINHYNQGIFAYMIVLLCVGFFLA